MRRSDLGKPRTATKRVRDRIPQPRGLSERPLKKKQWGEGCGIESRSRGVLAKDAKSERRASPFWGEGCGIESRSRGVLAKDPSN